MSKTVKKPASSHLRASARARTAKAGHMRVKTREKVQARAAVQTKRLEARIDKHLYEMIEKAAALKGQNSSEFVRASLHEAAQQALVNAHVLQLAIDDQSTFANALIQPPAPSDALIRAFKRQPSLQAK